MVIYLIFLTIMSVAAFLVYGADKQKARKNYWRTPEAVLLALGFFGGAVGALLGMKHFRHKTKHWYFWVVNYAGLIWQIIVLLILII